ncbi:MAG: hypothetical protein JWQ22_827 [Devosia sp.]|nr:hypothetical protein [Devosia sp.]
MFSSSLMAGFECGYLGSNGHDLLVSTQHVPGAKMAAHYAIAIEHGMTTARDGLPWRHDVPARIAAAARAGMEVIWDLNHYDPPPDAVDHARHCAAAADPGQALWLCPVNEPMLYPSLAGMSWEAAVDLAVTMARVARDHHPSVKLLSTDPITGIGERQFAATDRLVAAECVDVVGINYYPHTARTALLKVLLKTWRRYGKPILLSETSWHDGHREHHRRHPGFNKGGWLRHMLAEIQVARSMGVEIAGLCWYPIVDCPPWQRPSSRNRWSHGLIRADLSVDAALSHELMALRNI